MNRMIILSTITLLLFSSILFSQEFEAGNKIKVKVDAQVSRDSLGLMNYNYTIRSLLESQQNISSFSVIFKFNPDSISNAVRISGLWGPYIPEDDTLSWVNWSMPKKMQINPGDLMSGFVFITRFLPGITDYYAEGDHPVPSFEAGMAPDFIQGYDDLTPYGPGIVGKTVGPVLLPESVTNYTLLDTLISYKHQVFKTGWINNQGICNSLDQKLDNAKKQLEKGKTKQAVNMLNAFLNEVEAQNGKHLTSEAYALLKYNAEYLIEKLEE